MLKVENFALAFSYFSPVTGTWSIAPMVLKGMGGLRGGGGCWPRREAKCSRLLGCTWVGETDRIPRMLSTPCDIGVWVRLVEVLPPETLVGLPALGPFRLLPRMAANIHKPTCQSKHA